MSEKITKFFVVNVDTGEKIEVWPHSAGDTVHSEEIPDTAFGFARASLVGTPKWSEPENVGWWFDNCNSDGEFTKPESKQLDITGKWDFVQEEFEA